MNAMPGSGWLDYGALGAAMCVLLIAVGLLFRVLVWTREILELVLSRVQDNTHALASLSERIGTHEEAR